MARWLVGQSGSRSSMWSSWINTEEVTRLLLENGREREREREVVGRIRSFLLTALLSKVGSVYG